MLKIVEDLSHRFSRLPSVGVQSVWVQPRDSDPIVCRHGCSENWEQPQPSDRELAKGFNLRGVLAQAPVAVDVLFELHRISDI